MFFSQENWSWYSEGCRLRAQKFFYSNVQKYEMFNSIPEVIKEIETYDIILEHCLKDKYINNNIYKGKY